MATRIERHFRMWQSQRFLRQIINASTILQRWSRMKLSRERYISLRGSMITLQSLWRAWHTQKEFICLKLSACIVQAVFRRHKCIQRYRATRGAIVKIQRKCKRYLAEQKLSLDIARLAYHEKSAIVIQKQYRRFQLLRIEAACMLQSLCRLHRQRSAYMLARGSAFSIQACYRRHVQQKRYLNILHSVHILQAASRVFLARVAATSRLAAREDQVAISKL